MLWSGESRVLLSSHTSKRRKGKKDNKLADDEEEMMVAFLEANEMPWDKKATIYRRPDLKTTTWQKQAETMEEGSRLKQWRKEVSHEQGLFKGMRDNFARLDTLPNSGSGQPAFTERELWTLEKLNFFLKITYTTNLIQLAV